MVVKAQVKIGGRGKAGGVKLAQDPQDAVAKAREILGMDIKGHTVHRVLIAPAADIAEEYYFSFLVDRANRNYLCIASIEGGVEIEVTAHENPDAVAKVPIDPIVGVDDAKAREIVRGHPLPGRGRRRRPSRWSRSCGTSSSRRTPRWSRSTRWSRLGDGSLEALDGKVSLDGNAEFRHDDHASFELVEDVDPLELEAKEMDLNYVKLDGSVGIIGNGAGLVMSTLDVVAYAGEKHGGVKPANFLDIGGGASAEVMANGLDIILGDQQVKSVFVNVFGGITACDAVANGIVGALDKLGDEATKPLVVRLDGNNVEEGRRILAERNHPLVTLVDTMDGAADKAAELANDLQSA